MRKHFKYIFIFCICFMFINNINAEQRLNCNYKNERTNEIGIIFIEDIELDLILSGDNVSAKKVILTTVPKNYDECKKIATNAGESGIICETLTLDLTKNVTPPVELDFQISEGDSCPNNVALNRMPYKIYIPTNMTNPNNFHSTNNKISCGNITDIPKKIPELTSFAITLIQVAIPIVLIILGSIDLFKGITSQKEDEMKKGQQIFIKRLIAAAITFFVIIIIKFVVSIIADSIDTKNIVDCIDCFVDYESCGR